MGGGGAAPPPATGASPLGFPATILKRQIIALCAGKAAMAVLRDHKHDFGWKRVMTAERLSLTNTIFLLKPASTTRERREGWATLRNVSRARPVLVQTRCPRE